MMTEMTVNITSRCLISLYTSLYLSDLCGLTCVFKSNCIVVVLLIYFSFQRSNALNRRMKEREKEAEADARDRHKEREEMEELRKKLVAEGHPNPEAEINRRQNPNAVKEMEAESSPAVEAPAVSVKEVDTQSPVVLVSRITVQSPVVLVRVYLVSSVAHITCYFW